MNILIKNFWTTLTRFRTSSLLNIFGMAVAFAALYLILVQINHDLFFNHAIPDSERVYRVECPSYFQEGKYTPWITRPVAENCIKSIAAVEACGCGFFEGYECDFSVLHGKDFEQFKAGYSQISMQFIDVFGLKPISGKLADLEKPNSVALSASVAKQMGLEVGDSFFLGLVAQEKHRIQVVAIFADSPNNTDLSKLKIISSIGDEDIANESRNSFLYYVKLSADNDIDAVAKQANLNYAKRNSESGAKVGNADVNMDKPEIRFVPIRDTFYKTDVEGALCSMGSKPTTYMLMAVAILIVAIAFINFVNFFFALIPVRIRSINTRKVFGCSLAKLRFMLVFESFGLVLMALLVAAIIILYIEDTRLSQILSAPISIGQNIGIYVFTVALALAFSLFASLYPAYYITSCPTAMAIKSSFGTSKVGSWLRYSLVGFQFAISITLIIGAMFVHLQNRFMMHYDMGFNKESLLTVSIPSEISRQPESRMALESKLKESPTIKDFAWANSVFVAESREAWGRDFDNKQIMFQVYTVSWNFLNFIGVKVEEGRDFVPSDELKEDGTIIFNMTAKKRFGITLRSRINGHTEKPTKIAGFCKDFNFRPLQYGIEPFAFYVYGTHPWQIPCYLYLRLSPDADIEKVSDIVKDAVTKIDPKVFPDTIQLEFFDQELQRNYEKEKNLSLLITLFSLLTIIISLMGVFGLVMFETQYRMKEIALRRVHGASVTQILKMFNVKFLKAIVASFVIAAPISYYFIHSWLGSFAYRMPIYWWVFALALAIVLIITIATVTARSYSAATSDPAKLVKTE